MGIAITGGAGVKEETSMERNGGGGAAAGIPRSSNPRDGGAFANGEKVLAYHGPRLYEAKVQKTELQRDEWRYFIHYLGWNKNWDEWVGDDRLLKFTGENVRKQQALQKNQKH